jgi:outer membrane protein OmpA-like peptidoglycan-associated protein
MRYRVAIVLLFAFLAGCGGQAGKSFPVFFQPYSSALDAEGQATVQAAAAYANAHALMPVSIAGDATRPDTGDIDTLRQQRVAVVKDALVQAGLGAAGIDVFGTGLSYPNGDPSQIRGRVVINVGL